MVGCFIFGAMIEWKKRGIIMEYEKTGKLIQELRKEKGLTQIALAEMLGVTDRAVSKWERGKSFPDVSMLKPLAEALNVSVSELLDGELRPPDKMKQLPDSTAVMTVEDADNAAINGIHTYIHETQRQERQERVLLAAFVIVLLILMFTARHILYMRHLPVNFQKDSLEFSEVRVTLKDGSVQMISLDDPPGEELKHQIQNFLREEMPDTEEFGKLDYLPKSSIQGTCVKLEGLVTIYESACDDYTSYGSYTFPDIGRIHQTLYDMCVGYLNDTA